MPGNKYFSNGRKSEQLLYEDIVVEAIRMHGENVYYLPRKVVEMDMVLNEDTLSRFEEAYPVEMFLETVDGYEGDGKFLSKFGLEIRDQIILVVAKRRWNQLVASQTVNGETDPVKNRPKEGDLIYFPLVNGLFEIKYADADKPFKQLRGSWVYKLTCELFEYRNEDISTGVPDVDRIEATSAESFRVAVEVLGDAAVKPLEALTITLPTSIGGSTKALKVELVGEEVVVSVGTLTFDDNRFHTLVPGTVLTGVETGESVVVTRLLQLGDDIDAELFENDPVAQNSTFEEKGNDVIDFSEENPFGEPDDL